MEEGTSAEAPQELGAPPQPDVEAAQDLPEEESVGSGADAIFDSGRNWTAEATRALVRAWRKVILEGRGPDERTAHANQRILNVPLRSPCLSGSVRKCP
jgi:hypothetical protein